MRRTNNRPQIVICKCKSHCTTFNPATGSYEGNGQLQSRSTRDNHSRDDQWLRTGDTTQTVIMTRTARTPSRSASGGWLQQASIECEILMALPLSHPQRHFVFINPPEENGPFIWPNEHEILHPNTGLYALSNHRSNQPFLHVANYLHALLVQASRYDDQQAEDLLALVQLLRQKMNHLMRLKEVEWSRQRGARGVDIPFVNTG